MLMNINFYWFILWLTNTTLIEQNRNNSNNLRYETCVRSFEKNEAIEYTVIKSYLWSFEWDDNLRFTRVIIIYTFYDIRFILSFVCSKCQPLTIEFLPITLSTWRGPEPLYRQFKEGLRMDIFPFFLFTSENYKFAKCSWRKFLSREKKYVVSSFLNKK